jgi:hypothetical protein
MRRSGTLRAIVALAVCAAALAGPVSGASASRASIKHALKSFSGRVDVAEGEVVTAVGHYKTTKEPAPVEAAIGKSVTVLKALKEKIAAQSAGSSRIKTAKTKLLKGIGAVIVAYEHLGTAYGEHGTDQPAAEAEAKTALTELASAEKQLKEAAKLLS